MISEDQQSRLRNIPAEQPEASQSQRGSMAARAPGANGRPPDPPSCFLRGRAVAAASPPVADAVSGTNRLCREASESSSKPERHRQEQTPRVGPDQGSAGSEKRRQNSQKAQNPGEPSPAQREPALPRPPVLRLVPRLDAWAQPPLGRTGLGCDASCLAGSREGNERGAALVPGLVTARRPAGRSRRLRLRLLQLHELSGRASGLCGLAECSPTASRMKSQRRSPCQAHA